MIKLEPSRQFIPTFYRHRRQLLKSIQCILPSRLSTIPPLIMCGHPQNVEKASNGDANEKQMSVGEWSAGFDAEEFVAQALQAINNHFFFVSLSLSAESCSRLAINLPVSIFVSSSGSSALMN